jgi:hypothetical protein
MTLSGTNGQARVIKATEFDLHKWVTSAPPQEFVAPLPFALSVAELGLVTTHKFHPFECIQGPIYLEQEI